MLVSLQKTACQFLNKYIFTYLMSEKGSLSSNLTKWMEIFVYTVACE